ncbi:hypothetical protein SLS64_001065 [Diaporthe eres]|uniref:Uncharacterized protein n=1 Tax=Diaporthe eres TaxID=83184 RepID=A0ABR1NMK8_DIAER
MSDFNRLTRVRPGNVGSLGFLPLEVCNDIYGFLLTDFNPRPYGLEVSWSALNRLTGESTRAAHSIDTAILRVSRDIHLEAYDLMVKKNRFVHVRSRGVPEYLQSWTELPIVTANADHVRHFKGYVLEVNITYHKEPKLYMPPYTHDPFDAIILARDLDRLCEGFMRTAVLIPGLIDRFDLALNLGLVVTADPGARDYKDLESLEQNFSEKTQEEILQPFRDFLHDVRNIQIRGLVSADVVSSTCKGAALSKWDGPQEVLDYFAARKESAMQYLEREKTLLACDLLMMDSSEIFVMRSGSQWAQLVQEGDEHFITQLAEFYFRLNLDCAHLLMTTEHNHVVFEAVEMTLFQAEESTSADHWKEGFTWQPPQELRAKLHFRAARFFRLRSYNSDFEAAMTQLDHASLLCPDDPYITRERQLLMDSVSEPATAAW